MNFGETQTIRLQQLWIRYQQDSWDLDLEFTTIFPGTKAELKFTSLVFEIYPQCIDGALKRTNSDRHCCLPTLNPFHQNLDFVYVYPVSHAVMCFKRSCPELDLLKCQSLSLVVFGSVMDVRPRPGQQNQRHSLLGKGGRGVLRNNLEREF